MSILPSDISGLALWLKADALSLNNNDPVASWTDSSGLANDATQATGSKQPLYKTNIVNGKPVVRFDVTDDVLGATLDSSIPTDFTTIIVIWPNTIFNYTIYLGGQPDPSDDPWTFGPVIHGSGSGTIYAGIDSANRIDTGGGYYTAQAWQILTLRKSGAASGNLSLWINGGNLKQNTGLTSGAPTGDKMYFAPGADVDVAEIIVYYSALSTLDRQRIEWYLAEKYAISGPTNPDGGSIPVFIHLSGQMRTS